MLALSLGLTILLNAPRHEYTLRTFQIRMRDGVHLHTRVFVPKDVRSFPLMMERTPYGVDDYEPDGLAFLPQFRTYVEGGYGIVAQDVRGQNGSEGTFVNVRPLLPPGAQGVDEATDTYDTVEFLIHNVPGNNGRVGLTGVSYPGFYAAVGAFANHPAIKAVAPHAAVSDWYMGDDVRHNGVFFLRQQYEFAYFYASESHRPQLKLKLTPYPDGPSEFFRKQGSAGALSKNFFQGLLPFWDEILAHPNYDAFWKARSLPLQMKRAATPILNVGGWFDSEDLYGPLHDFAAAEKSPAHRENFLVMGPWVHGGSLFWMPVGIGDAPFISGRVDGVYRQFFDHYLLDASIELPAKATVFETGANVWRSLDAWPPPNLKNRSLFLGDSHNLTWKEGGAGSDSYVNDPKNPTPFEADPNSQDLGRLFEDQTWASARKDVLTYTSAPVDRTFTIAGPIFVDLWVKSTGTDGDFVVKLIDIPGDGDYNPRQLRMIRGDVMRARFRKSFSHPEPLVPGQPTLIHFTLNDVFHTVKYGHKVAVQVQSSWFPLTEQNPNTFVDVGYAGPEDYHPATITLLHGKGHPSRLSFGVFAPAL